MSIEDNQYSGRPSISRTKDIIALVQKKKKIRNEQQPIVKKVANDLGISIGSCHSILTKELSIKRVSKNLVSKLLIENQMEHRIKACLNLKINLLVNLNLCNPPFQMTKCV